MEQEEKKIELKIKFDWILVLILLAIIFLLFQSIYILAFLDKLVALLPQELQYSKLLEAYQIQEKMLKGSLRAIAFFWLTLACWFGFGIFQMKEKKAFWHFLIPSILALISGRWDSGICGIIASIIYKRRVSK